MYNSIMKTLARFVQERREQVGLSVTGLAKRCNISPEIRVVFAGYNKAKFV